MGRNDGGKKFARKFVPKMVQKILGSAADAAVVVRRAQDDNVRVLNARLQFLPRSPL